MGIMDVFKQAPTPPANTPQPTLVAADPNNPHLPAPNPDPAANKQPEDKSPMAGHIKVWENDPTKKAAEPDAPLFDLDPAKLAEAVKGANFAAKVDPELITKALAGDAAAFAEAMNSVTQQAYSSQTMTVTKLIEQAMEKQKASMSASMPELVRQSQIKEQLNGDPIFQHPATAPLLQSLTAQLTKQFPQASASQITEQARQYVADFASMAAGKPAEDKSEVSASENWAGFELPPN